MSGLFSIPVVYIDNRGQFLIPYFIYFSRILHRIGGGILSMAKPNLGNIGYTFSSLFLFVYFVK
jgi:hypothetical protein